jgi:hypothetical protein
MSCTSTVCVWTHLTAASSHQSAPSTGKRLQPVLGLAGGVGPSHLEKVMFVARSLRAGTVWINEWYLLNERAPFGGYRQSGIGLNGLHEATESKRVYIDEPGVRKKKTRYDGVTPGNLPCPVA